MKWTKLKINALPVIAVQADTAILKLEQLAEQINNNANQQDIVDLNNLREAIQLRIDELDRFYEMNHLDGTISIFHMIKLKLKRAIFKVPNIYNDTISIQMLHSQNNKEQEYLKNNEKKVKLFQPKNTLTGQPKLKIQMKSKRKPNNKSKQKNDILRLLQTSRRDEQQTNLMQDFHDVRNIQYQPISFDVNDNEAYSSLFKTDRQFQTLQEKDQKKSKDKNLKLRNKKQMVGNKNKSISPMTKKTKIGNQNMNKSPIKVPQSKVNSYKSKQFTQKQSSNIYKSTNMKNEMNKSKKPVQQNSSKLQSKKAKTQNEQIRILEQQNNDKAEQFKFTIKMTKEDYMNLIKMKQALKNDKNLSKKL